jgi:hypothetical protein
MPCFKITLKMKDLTVKDRIFRERKDEEKLKIKKIN